MTVTCTLKEAETKLAALVELVERGEEVVIEREGKTIAVLHAPPLTQPDRVPGTLAHLGQLRDPYMFLASDPDLEAAAHGEVRV